MPFNDPLPQKQEKSVPEPAPQPPQDQTEQDIWLRYAPDTD